jgi:hypothetical protein
MNWRSNSLRTAAISRLRANASTLRELCKQHPAAFRVVVRTGTPPETLGPRLLAWQERDFAAIDQAWLQLAKCRSRDPSGTRWEVQPTGEVPLGSRHLQKSPGFCRRAYIERPRGHSKTTDMAIQVAWILQFATRTVRGLAAAADQDQARLIHAAVSDLVRQNQGLCPDLAVRENRVQHRGTGSQLEIISSDVSSSWGQLPDFVICDELCHWPRADLWYSLCSSAAKQPHCVLAVLTNAGVGTGWQWTVREAARTSPEWHFSSLTGPQAPWITDASLAEQRRLLPPAVYARLWDNVWQHSDGEFVTLAEAEACRESWRRPQSRGFRGRRYFAAVDYAEKRDRTVGVVVHREGDRIVVDRMDVAVPQAERPVLVSWVEEWIADVAARFGSVRFVLDEYQLLSVIQRLEGRHEIERFDFAGGRGNHALAMTLRNLIVHGQVAWYPGCGQLPDTDTRDDLETELGSLILRNVSGVRVRIDHRREAGCHDDRAFALGAACLAAIQEAGGPEAFAITPPNADGGFAL